MVLLKLLLELLLHILIVGFDLSRVLHLNNCLDVRLFGRDFLRTLYRLFHAVSASFALALLQLSLQCSLRCLLVPVQTSLGFSHLLLNLTSKVRISLSSLLDGTLNRLVNSTRLLGTHRLALRCALGKHLSFKCCLLSSLLLHKLNSVLTSDFSNRLSMLLPLRRLLRIKLSLQTRTLARLVSIHLRQHVALLVLIF